MDKPLKTTAAAPSTPVGPKEVARPLPSMQAEAGGVAGGGGRARAVRVWDARSARETAQMKHPCPVDAMLVLPGGTMLATAGGTVIKLWDLTAGGKEVGSLSNHHKNITCLTLDGDRRRLLSGSLDQHVKVYDLTTHKVVASLDFPSPLLSLAVNRTNESVFVGMTNGTFAIRSRKSKADEAEPSMLPGQVFFRAPHQKTFGGTKAHFNRSGAGGGGSSGGASGGEEDGDVGAAKRRPKLTKVDKDLRSFAYQNALESALATNNPLVVVSLFEELYQRGGVRRAVSAREEKGLIMLLGFLVKHINNPGFTQVLVEVSNVVLDVYAGMLGQSVGVDELVQRLRDKLAVEIALQYKLKSLAGLVEMLRVAAKQARTEVATVPALNNPYMSAAALDDDLDEWVGDATPAAKKKGKKAVASGTGDAMDATPLANGNGNGTATATPKGKKRKKSKGGSKVKGA